MDGSVGTLRADARNRPIPPTAVAADEPVVGYEQYVRVQHARRNRLALILDIAIPRDFDPKVGTLDRVMLYNVDDLRAQAEDNRKRRQKRVDPAQAIIEQEAAACYAALRHHRGTTIDQARDIVADVNYFGTMMVHTGRADGMVSGAASLDSPKKERMTCTSSTVVVSSSEMPRV